MASALAAVDLVLFDCDGTLVDSEVLAADALAEYVALHGVSITAAEALMRFKGWKMDDCVTELGRMRGAALPAEFVSQLRQRTAILFSSRLQPIEGALELLQSLSVPFCLASNGPRDKIALSLGITGLLPYFSEDRIFSGYEIGSWKPAPDLFLHAAAAVGAAPQRCLVVEDSVPGMLAGLAAGMTVFGLQPGVHDADIPPGVHLVSSLAELQQRLQAA
jgi:HAD superfamily hydrolase (TIGR01509 family)